MGLGGGFWLDSLDISILRCVTGVAWEPFNPRSSATIARQIGVDEATVRTRMKRWEASGFLTRFAVTPSVSLLGLGACILRIEVPRLSEKDAIKRKLHLVDGVYRIRDFVGNSLAVSLFYEDDEALERRVKLIEEISGVARSSRIITRIAHSEKPNPIDVLLMAAMFWPAGKTRAALAKETGLSPKTVSRRIEGMVKGQMLERINFFDFRKLKGTLVADLFVYYKSLRDKAETDREIVSSIGDRLFPPVWPANNSGLFRVLLGNFAEQRELLSEVMALKNVSSAYLDIVADDIILVESLYKYDGAFFEKMANFRYLTSISDLWSHSRSLSTNEIYPRRLESIHRTS